MTLTALLEQHPDLAYNQGDPVFRRSVWGPFFGNLHGNKVIYRERFICLARIDDLEIDDKGVRGTVVPLVYLFTYPHLRIPARPWRFGGSWAHMWQTGNKLGQPYAGWTIWPEPPLVRAVEHLIAQDATEGALELIRGIED